MMEVGRDQLLNKGVSEVEFCQANAELLPFAKASFHCISMGFGLRNVTHKEVALLEMHRVLKPAGRLSMSDPISPREMPEHLRDDAQLRAQCISGCLKYDLYIDKIVQAGFGAIEIRSRRPYRMLDRKRYGLDHESLLVRSPRLVMGAISGYGLGGEEQDRPAFDYAAYWARTGMMDAMRDEGLPPSLQRPGMGDHAAASNLVCGILAALRMVEATGQGRYVDVSLLQTGLYILGNDVANALVTREPARRHDRREPANPLWNSYPVAEDRWILLVMIDADRYWPRFCEAIERPDLRDDPRFVDGFARTAHSRELVKELEHVFQQQPLAAWKLRLDAADLIWSPVQTLDEAIEDPQAHALGYFQQLEHERAGRFETVAVPLRIEGVPIGANRPVSDLHADAEAVLREAGLSDAEIEKLLGLRAAPAARP